MENHRKMKLKKQKKCRKMRGSRYHGYAAKKHKGKGNVGGKGMSGTGKRADQKKTFVIRYLYPYFGKQGFTSRGTRKDKKNEINVGDIEKNLKSLEKEGKVKRTKEGIEVEFKNYKILGKGEIKEKMIIKASSFSKQAKEKIEKAGGKVIIWGKKAEEAKEERKERAVEKAGEKKSEKE